VSLRSLTGQKASEPILFVKRLTGAPNLSAHAQVLSKPFLLVVFVLSHEGSHETALCILPVALLLAKLRESLRLGYSRWDGEKYRPMTTGWFFSAYAMCAMSKSKQFEAAKI
jgi:hypothetical protein